VIGGGGTADVRIRGPPPDRSVTIVITIIDRKRTMKISIGSTIASAATSAVRNLGTPLATLAVRHVPPASAGPDDPPARDIALIKIEVNINR
jgi:hypothetical protein